MKELITVNIQTILLLVLPAAALGLITRLYDPQHPGARLMGYTLGGLLLLLGWNLLFQPKVGVNPLSAAITGLLGLPGVGLTVLLNLL